MTVDSSTRTHLRPRIPFNAPSIEGKEIEYVRLAVETGHSASSGPFSARVSEVIRESIGAVDVLMTTSCTDALEMTAMLLDFRPGDSVIVPSFTFVSTALAFARQGVKLLFADIERETLGIDSRHVEELLDDSVRAVVAVHYAGVGCDLARLKPVLARAHGVDLVEDNAHGLFGSYRGRALGSFGRFATLSFHETKNFVCGEGGALILNRSEDVDRAHVLYDKGTNRRAFLLGQVDKYSWTDLGSSFGLSDILAAYLAGQLEARDVILAKRRRISERYDELLAPHAAEYGFSVPNVPGDRQQAYHMYYVLLPDRETRDHALAYLAEHNIQATFHYIPLHSSAGAQPHIAKPTDCPVAEEVSGRLLRLPFYNQLRDEDIDRVVKTFLGALARS